MIREHHIYKFCVQDTATEYHHDVYGDRVEPGIRKPRERTFNVIAKGESVAMAKVKDMTRHLEECHITLDGAEDIAALLFEPTW